MNIPQNMLVDLLSQTGSRELRLTVVQFATERGRESIDGALLKPTARHMNRRVKAGIPYKWWVYDLVKDSIFIPQLTAANPRAQSTAVNLDIIMYQSDNKWSQ